MRFSTLLITLILIAGAITGIGAAQQAMQPIAPGVGSIQVTSSPSGATVILDGTFSRITPTTFTDVPAGYHTVDIYLEGYFPYYSAVNVYSGQTAYISATLSTEVTVGSLSVDSYPTGASVYVDGAYRGVTPTVVGNLIKGTHPVTLVKAGYFDWENKVTIYAGQTTYLTPTLDPNPAAMYGSVSIVSNPSGADVYASGVYIGRTTSGYPLIYNQVRPGTYTVVLKKEGYQDFQRTQTVVAGQNYELVCNLVPVPNPTTGSIAVISSPYGAQVYINNVFRGLSPLTLDGFNPGAYSVLVRLNGYKDWQSSVPVSAGQTAQVTAVLIPEPIQTTTVPTTTQTPILPTTAVIGLMAGGFIVLHLRKRV